VKITAIDTIGLKEFPNLPRVEVHTVADIVIEPLPLKDGFITAPEGPGLGTKLRPGLRERPDAIVRRSEYRP
jgi:L-alanine-DL-glutamate epimerase-like enolase superfamily enzyme